MLMVGPRRYHDQCPLSVVAAHRASGRYPCEMQAETLMRVAWMSFSLT